MSNRIQSRPAIQMLAILVCEEGKSAKESVFPCISS